MSEFRYIRNSEELLGHGHVQVRRDALRILDRVLVAVDPYFACLEAVRFQGDALCVRERRFPLAKGGRIWFVGAGKASLHIAKAIEELAGDRLQGGLVICKEGQRADLRRVRILYASHPVPSAASVAAAREMMICAGHPRAGDIVICGITGGSSALLTLPPSGIEIEDMQQLTKVLLTCGADIFEINAVRKHLSGVGGGRLAHAFRSGVCLVNLTVSDVIGDALDYITDPTVPDTSTIADARATLEKFDLWDRVPSRVRAFLAEGGNVTETPKRVPWPADHTFVLLSASSPVDACRRAAQELGYHPLVLSSSFAGESHALGAAFAAVAREIAQHGRPVGRPCAVIGGGETIVTMKGFEGLGGPNQEFALSAAFELPADCAAVTVGIDTDGTDGPTDVAGAMCDASTLSRGKERNIDLRRALHRHNVTPVLQELQDAIVTGATGTNVNDLKLVLFG